MQKGFIEQSKHAVMCVEVVTFVRHVLTTELPVFTLPVFFSRLHARTVCLFVLSLRSRCHWPFCYVFTPCKPASFS